MLAGKVGADCAEENPVAESKATPRARRPTPRQMAATRRPFPPFQKRAPLLRSWCRSLIAFVALYLIVSRIALPRVGKTIDDRQSAIEGDLAAAQKLKDESDSALKAYESELAAARSRAQAIGTETREKLNAASEAERKTLEDAARRSSLPRPRRPSPRRATTAMSNVRGIAAEAASAIVQRLIGVPPDGKAVETRRRSVVEGIVTMFYRSGILGRRRLRPPDGACSAISASIAPC